MGLMKFIISYWSQIVVLIGVISSPFIYFFRTRFDYKSKVLEIKQTVHQQQRIKVINEFIIAYTALENFYWQLPSFDIAERKISGKAVDDMHLPILNAFTSSYYSLFLIIDKSDLVEFDKIRNEMTGTKNAVGDLFGFSNTDSPVTARTNQYYSRCTTMVENNKQSLKKIGEQIIASYNK